MKSKTVLITGASRGIGKAIAHAFASQNYNLFINCNTSINELELVKKDLVQSYGTKCELLIGDVGNATIVDAMFATISQKTGGIDVLVNNAGVASLGLLSDLTSEEWNRLLHTNLSSVFYCSKAAIPYMVSQKSGKIINISSMWGVVGASCEAAYSATKAGVHGLTKSLAKELAPSNIQVNAIACGAIDTIMNAGLNKEERISLEQDIPSGRFGTAKEVADLVINLASSHPYLTGQIIGLDGGII